MDEFCSAYGRALDDMAATVHATSNPREFKIQGVRAENPEGAEDWFNEVRRDDLRENFRIVPGKTKGESSRLWLVEALDHGKATAGQKVWAQHPDDALPAAEISEPGKYQVSLADGTGGRWLYSQAADGTVTRVPRRRPKPR